LPVSPFYRMDFAEGEQYQHFLKAAVSAALTDQGKRF
jgi:hypothetical protein